MTEDVRYFIVEDKEGNKFFVKEALYNDWLSKKMYPNDSLNNFIRNQFERCKAVEEVTDNVVKALAFSKRFILFEYCDWKNLVDIGNLDEKMYKEIKRTAFAIWNKIGSFDFNVNNILVKDGEFKFIDFEYGECDFDERLSRFSNMLSSMGTTSQGRIKSKRIVLPDFYYKNNNYWGHMITSKCNAECVYCLVNGRGQHVRQKELSGKEILEWWNNIEHPDGWPLSFMARETTLHPDIVELINNIDGYFVTITTNCSGPFYTGNFEKRFKPLPSTRLRINTSYHPHILEPEKYVERIKRFRDAGFHVGQTMFVYTPEVMEKWGDRIEKVREYLDLEYPPYLGFWTDEDRFDASPCPENLMPNENYHDQETARTLCGIDDYDLYRKWCGQAEPKTVYCPHALLCLLVSPSGKVYHCHYRMYYDKDPICDIKNFKPIEDIEQLRCNFHGYTNWCDYPRLRKAIQIFKVEGIKWLEEIKSK